MPCIEYKGKKYTYEEFGAMLRDGAFAKMAKSGELNIENLGAKVPSSLLETTRKKITPETSSNFANLTVDEDGNYVFFHRGAKGYTEIKPGTGQSGITPSNEATAIGRVGGVAMYYTTPDESERMVSGDAQYAVTVAPDEVYDFNEDPENYIVEARDRFEKENPGKAFDANNQLAYITKIAGENGYKMVVAEWINGRTRAQTTEAMKPTDVKLLDGDVVKKDFDKKYKKNKDMGWESVVPETKDDKLNKLYLKIYKERSDKNRYDDLYHLAEDAPKKTQDEITKLINESDISQELKDEYNQILGEKEQTRKSKKKVANDTVAEVERIKSLDKAAEDGATFNLDGTKYEGVGLVVPAASVNTTVEELTPEMIMDFVEQQRSKIGDDAVVKVGIYKFKNSNKVSIDLNIIAPESSRDVAIEFGRLAGQESLFDLRTFENIKTGADGKNPMKFSDKQFKEIAKALKEGKMPNVFGAKETTALDDIFNNEAIQSEVDNALKAMSEIMPELNIVVHDTYESYLEALGESEEAESGGFFDGENTIHINRRAASDTTVAHEVFHAVLKKMLGSERAIQKKALSMVLNLSGQIKSDPKLKAALNEFVSRYTENPETMNEEAVSELFGMLNAGYAELKPVERSAIRKFIDAIAKLLGLGDLLRVKENEYVDLLNTLSQRIRTGEAITAEDVNVITRGLTASDEINSMGVSGVINTNNVTKKKSILATGEFERYPVNPNAKVEENVPLSRFDGKRSNVFESDRMTGAFIADDQGNKLFNFFGGIFYPIITGKWWASNTMTKASGIARNSKRDADGYIYGTPIIMKPGSQMSNNDMLLATLELMKMDALKKNSGVTKAELMSYIEKAFDKKKISNKKNIIKNALKRSNNIEQIFDELEYTLFQEEGFIKDRNGNDILNDNGQRIKSLTFDERKEFVSGVLGDRKVVSDKFPSAGSMSAMAEKFTEPETKKSKNVHDIVIVYRTKGDLVPKKSDKKDPFYHKSYPYEISAENKDGIPAEIEVFILDGAYNLSEAIKELTKSSGETFSYEEYYKKIEQGKYKSEKVAIAQYGRTAKLSYASGEISAKRKQTPSISKKIEAALNSGATEQEIIDKMTQVGYTESEAKAYIDQYNNMRSDEYSRVKANIDTITKKVADRAGKNANPKAVRQRQYDDAMNYLQNSLWYENASDTEREASVRELRSDLGFREKAAPSAAKVTEGKRDTITIDSLQALNQSIRDQNIGAKAALKDLAEKREALRVALNALVNKAKITARQATTILNKFSKVNLNDDQAVKDLIDYVEQTYKDAEITNQVRQAAQTAKDERRGAKAALKDLAEKREALRVALKSLVTSGKITNRQASVMLNKVMSVNLNNDNAVDKLIKYIEKVYNNAEIAEKMSKANGMRRTAKKNIKSKIGSAKVAFPLLDKLFSIDSRQIPLEVLDTYSNLVNQFGKRVGVLTTDNMSSVIQDAQDVIDAINEEESRANDLAMIFDMYPDKVTDSNGEIDFNQTVKKMKDEGYIDEATAKEMDEYRTDIFKKERATREDDAQERRDLIAEISAARLVTSSRLADPNERKAAREIIQMARSRTLLKKLSTTSLRNLAAIMKNIDAGFFPNYGVKLMQAMQVEQQAPLVNETVSDVSLRVISTAYNRFKALTKLEGWRNNTGVAIQKTLESNMSTDLDFMLGDNKKRYIYDYIIKPLAKAYASFDTEATAVKEKMTEAVNMLEKQFNGNTNRVAESKFKMMAYMLQKEFETNPGQKGVAPAVDFINQTIKAIKARDTEYSERDIELLESIKNSYSTNGQIDMNKIFDSFSPREKKALSIVEDLNKSMYDKAIFTSGVIRGNRTQMYNNYVPHSVLPSKMSKDDKITSVNNAYNNTQAVGTKAGSLQQRTPGAKPIMFDPFLASMNSAVDILLDFHMTIPMQTTNKLVRKVKKDLNDNPNTTNKSKDAINAIQQVRDNITKFVFTNNKYYDDSVFGSLGRSFLSTMYRNTLGSVPRFANELISNFSYVIANPKNFLTGLKHVFKDSDYINGVSGRDIMTSVGSTVTGKLYGKNNTGKFSDIGFLGSDNASHGSKSKNAFENTKDIISRYTKKPMAELTEYVGDKLVSTPDMLMSKPTWFGAFANEFKKQTGTDVEFSKLTDERYKNKYKAAIDAATDYADNEVIQAGSTVNPFQKAAKMNVDQSAPVSRKLFAQVNNYLTNFMITEFSTARAAAYSLVTEGRLPKAKAAGVMTGVYMRIVMYTLLSNAMAGVFYGALGYDDDDEETITWDDIVQAATGGFISILVNRNFGNLFKMVENYGVEKLNEEYGDMLRSGEEYDPYKHSLAFNKIKEKDIARDPAKFATVTLAGPYAMPVKTAWKISDLIEYEGRYVGKGAEQKIIQKEKDYSIGGVLKKKRMEKTKDEVLFNVAAGSGLVPFAKDIRPIISGVQKKKGEN